MDTRDQDDKATSAVFAVIERMQRMEDEWKKDDLQQIDESSRLEDEMIEKLKTKGISSYKTRNDKWLFYREWPLWLTYDEVERALH